MYINIHIATFFLYYLPTSYGNLSTEPFGNIFKLPDPATKIPVLAKLIQLENVPNWQINADVKNRCVF